MSIIVNISKMFETIEPWDCSNSVAEYGSEQVGKITWENCMSIARRHAEWLNSDEQQAVAALREHAAEYGAWDDAEIASWSNVECLALMVQEIAADLREHLGVDNQELEGCLDTYETTDWDKQPGSPRVHLYLSEEAVRGARSDVMGDYC